MIELGMSFLPLLFFSLAQAFGSLAESLRTGTGGGNSALTAACALLLRSAGTPGAGPQVISRLRSLPQEKPAVMREVGVAERGLDAM